ncbi:MAG: diguanylate cyclase [Oceanobacter sp.]
MIFNSWKVGGASARLAVLMMAAVLQLVLVAEQYLLGRPLGVTIFLGVFPLLLMVCFALWVGNDHRYLDILIGLSFAMISLLILALYFHYSSSFYVLVGVSLLAYVAVEKRTARKHSGLTLALLIPVAFYRYPWEDAVADVLGFLLCTMALNYWLFVVSIRGRIADNLSLRDKASGAFEERYLFALLEQEQERQKRGEAECSLIAIALEYAQLVEIYGESAVACFLPDLTQQLKAEIRAGDEVFRISNDVFVLMLPACPEDNAGILMERIKRKITKKAWDHVNDLDVTVATTHSSTTESVEDIKTRLLTRLARQQKVSLDASSF